MRGCAPCGRNTGAGEPAGTRGSARQQSDSSLCEFTRTCGSFFVYKPELLVLSARTQGWLGLGLAITWDLKGPSVPKSLPGQNGWSLGLG